MRRHLPLQRRDDLIDDPSGIVSMLLQRCQLQLSKLAQVENVEAFLGFEHRSALDHGRNANAAHFYTVEDRVDDCQCAEDERCNQRCLD